MSPFVERKTNCCGTSRARKSGDLTKLVGEVRDWGTKGVDFEIDDGHKDGLRKAKYLIQNRPPYFSGSAIGIRVDYAVSVPCR